MTRCTRCHSLGVIHDWEYVGPLHYTHAKLLFYKCLLCGWRNKGNVYQKSLIDENLGVDNYVKV